MSVSLRSNAYPLRCCEDCDLNGEKTAFSPCCDSPEGGLLVTSGCPESAAFPVTHEFSPRRTRRQGLALGSRCTAILVLVLVVIAGYQTTGRFKGDARTADHKAAAWHASNSSDGALNLVELYPGLEAGASKGCGIAWRESAARIECHRTALSPVFDKGNATEALAAGLDLLTSTMDVCNNVCYDSVFTLAEAMRENCSGRLDRFNITAYDRDGRAYFDKAAIEDGPLKLAQTLQERNRKLCEWGRYGNKWGTCAATLWMRWGIIDGLNTPTIDGVNEFLKRTNTRKTVKGGNVTGLDSWRDGRFIRSEKLIPDLEVGPGTNETDCGWCTTDWFRKKLESFEVGKILDSLTGHAISRREFYDTMTEAVKRCKRKGFHDNPEWMLRSTRESWERSGWWCDDKPCEEGDAVKSTAQKAIYGLSKDDSPLPEICAQIREGTLPIEPLEALHTGLQRLPCSIWFNKETTLANIVPHNHVISHICSTTCRDAIDRMQAHHGAAFSAASRPDNIFEKWASVRNQLDKICLAMPETFRNSFWQEEAFCAPGYAAVNRSEWLFAPLPPSNSEVLAALAPAVDTLFPILPSKDNKFNNIMPRLVSESIFNNCLRLLLLGPMTYPNYTQRIDEFLGDKNVDRNLYVRVAKAYLRMEFGKVRDNMDDWGWDDGYDYLGVPGGTWEVLGLDRYE